MLKNIYKILKGKVLLSLRRHINVKNVFFKFSQKRLNLNIFFLNIHSFKISIVLVDIIYLHGVALTTK